MVVVAYITVPEESLARQLAQQLVERRLASGVNVAGPVFSYYRWQGEICIATEWLIFAQATREGFEELKGFVVAHHPHQVPCILALDVLGGFAPFIEWIANKGESPCASPLSPCKP